MNIMENVVPAGRREPKIYVGNAEPEGVTAVVGGREVVVGGWGKYEADRRRAKWEAAPRDPYQVPAARYGGRSYITAQDTLDSLVTARVSGGDEAPVLPDPLEVACGRLSAQLIAAENTTDRVVRGGTVEDVENLPMETSPAALHQVAEDAIIYAGALADLDLQLPPPPPAGIPPLPTRSVRVVTGSGESHSEVSKLELASSTRADAITTYRGVLAGHLENAARALADASAKKN
jgi:hypothetical protein